ncbi:MAG: hypothetical protein WBM32_04265 [Crocosphaera sp.]|jgi:hypothetical protein
MVQGETKPIKSIQVLVVVSLLEKFMKSEVPRYAAARLHRSQKSEVKISGRL